MLQAPAVIVCALIPSLAVTPWTGASNSSVEQKYATSDYSSMPEPVEDEQTWEMLEGLSSLLCIVLDCTADSWKAEASSGKADKVEGQIRAQIESFESGGISFGITDSQRDAGIRDADAVARFVWGNPDLLEPGLESSYLNALDEIIQELSMP